MDHPECLTFFIGKTDADYFYVTIYEKHTSGCPGDPKTSPRVNFFRINRSTQKIEVDNKMMDVNGLGEWLTYDEFKKLKLK